MSAFFASLTWTHLLTFLLGLIPGGLGGLLYGKSTTATTTNADITNTVAAMKADLSTAATNVKTEIKNAVAAVK